MSDGKPGNGKPRDSFDITVRLVGVNSHDVKLLHATAVNVAPVITEHPKIKIEQESGIWVVSITNVNYADPGIRDAFSISTSWGDGKQTTVRPVGTAATSPNTTRPSELKRILSVGDRVFPATLTVEDDDKGQATYRFERISVEINADDDNKNGDADYLDNGPAEKENDLLRLDLTSILNGLKTDANGTVYLRYSYKDISLPPEQYHPIRLWQNSNKSGQPLKPVLGTDSHNGWTLPGDMTAVWIEGTRIGTDNIYVDWMPKNNAGIRDAVDGAKQSLGSIWVDVIARAPGNLAIEESYWGTSDKWFPTDDDDILWRHNKHQLSIQLFGGYAVANIKSIKVYSIADEKVATIAFPEVG